MRDWNRVREKIRQGALKELWAEARWILRYIVRYRKAVIFYICIGVAGALTGLLGSLTSKYAIDAVTGQQAELLVWMVALFAVTGFGSVGLQAVMKRMLTRISLKINREMMEEVYTRILSTEWTAMNGYHSGDLLNRINIDVRQVAGSVLGWVPSLIIQSVHFIGSLGIILYYDPVMALLALLSAPVTVLVSRVFLYKMREYNKRMRQADSEMMGFTEESFQHIQSIKSLHLTDLFRNRLKKVQENYVGTSLEYNDFSVGTSAFLSSVSLVISFLCMGWGVYRLWTGYITYGTMTLFLQLARSLSGDFSSLIRLVPSAISAATSAGRIMDVTELPREPEGDRENVREMAREAAEGIGITLQGVNVSYEEGKPVLRDCELSVKPGETVALMGRSGSGKTTLLRLILGIVHSSSGTAVMYTRSGGRTEPLGAATRELIAYVPQGNTVFSGTILENLVMVAPDASEEEAEEALKTACAWDFVKELPDGIHSVVGEKGNGLSEGQAQRISIARAVLKKAPVILFDEATSALDEETGRQVLCNIRRKMEHCTCIIVTHRSSLLEACTSVFRLENGKLIRAAEGQNDEE